MDAYPQWILRKGEETESNFRAMLCCRRCLYAVPPRSVSVLLLLLLLLLLMSLLLSSPVPDQASRLIVMPLLVPLFVLKEPHSHRG